MENFCRPISEEVPRRHPDYLAIKEGESYYVEVKYLTLLSQDEIKLERFENTIWDARDKVDASNFSLKIYPLRVKNNKQPSGKRIVEFYNSELAGIDPDEYTIQVMEKGYKAMPKIIYEDDSVEIDVQLFPKIPSKRGIPSRAIGARTSVTRMGNDSKAIKTALLEKASAYGRLDAPYVICLNKPKLSLDKDEFEEALFSSSTMDGFFSSVSKPRFMNVSGVYITNTDIYNLGSSKRFYQSNPSAQFPTDFSINPDEIMNIFC